MTGSAFYPLSEQIADTIRAHGFDWTRAYYIIDRKVPAREFYLLALGGLQS